jgi:RNA polymerase sigma factor (sigma-70 family)
MFYRVTKIYSLVLLSMDGPSEQFIRIIETALQTLEDQYGQDLIQRIRPIVLSVQGTKRVNSFTRGDVNKIQIHLHEIIQNYTLWYPHLYAVQVERNTEVWRNLYGNLIDASYRFFIFKHFAANEDTHLLAEECAGRCASAILIGHFPYDIEFEAWVHKIVQNQCYKYMREQLRKSEVPSNKQVPLEEELVTGREESGVHLELEKKELMNAITQAISQLSENKKEILKLRYYEELAPREIAQKTGKSLDAIYSLQFYAIQEIRKILVESGIILNE